MSVSDYLPMTDDQRATIAYFRSLANENGATIQVRGIGNGELGITETASADCDFEITQWIVGADGVAEIQ